ncbi:MAG TPA: cytidylate kinase family protein [Candidatus Binatia bacterium]|nr:cytidylate kinase family protein [Candidatus Binatia bacterium]
MIVTIGGDAGSGKSTVAQLLAKKLKFKYYSVGNFMRQMAAARGLTIEQYLEATKDSVEADKEADAYQQKLGKSEDNFVLESRLGWKFVPKSLKVFLTVDENVAAERILRDHKAGKRPSEQKITTLKEALSEIRARRKNNVARYKKFYNVNHLDKTHYDVVIDTTDKTIEQVADEILAKVKK